MTVIHSAEFARDGAQLEGVMALGNMPRLADQLAEKTGEVHWQLVGGIDELDRPYLNLMIKGEVKLICQRCMQPMVLLVDADTILTQFADEAKLDEAIELDEDLEGILIEPELDVEHLIEDEVLLALPYAPRHDKCGAETGAAKQAGATKPNPFAILAQLKTGKAEDSN